MLTPVDVLNAVSNGTLSYAEAIHWACARISTEPELADDPLWMDLAILRAGNNEDESQVGKLLRRLIDATIDFRLSENTIEQYRRFANDCRDGRIESLSKADFWPLVLGCLPELIPRWERLLTECHGERCGMYSDEIGVLNSYAQQQIRQNASERLQAIAEVIELAICRGDEEVRGVAIVGFLEGVTNACSHTPDELPAERLVVRLGEHSLEALRELDRFWGTRTLGT